LSTRNIFRSKRRIAKEKELYYNQKLLEWHESRAGKEVMERLEKGFMPFALQHSRYLVLSSRTLYFGNHHYFFPPDVILRSFEDNISDDEAAGVVRRMRDAFTHVVGDFTLAGALAMVEGFEDQINSHLQHKEELSHDAAYFHQVRAGARRMTLLAEAFRKNLDGEPIFVELAAATTPQELEVLADRLSATPALTPLVAFDRALTS
jgi:hypothetical protein